MSEPKPSSISDDINQTLKRVPVVSDSCKDAEVIWRSIVNRQDISSYRWCSNLICSDCKGVQAYCYLHGIGCPKDPTFAYKLASEVKGSQYGLITMAKCQYGTERIQAIQLCLRAAELGLGKACYYVGKELLRGTFVPRDVVEAHKWLKHAADMEDPEALCLLANCFLEGKGVTKNISTAIDLLERAKRSGYIIAEFALLFAHSEAVKV